MRTRLRATLAAATLLMLSPGGAGAQGVTTAGIRGTVRGAVRERIDARVHIVHEGTGYSTEIGLTEGRFLVQGLEPGGPYRVTARALGFVPQRQERVMLALGELREIDFELQPVARPLDTVAVVVDDRLIRGRRRADGGTGTTIPESMIDRLPALNRSFLDFVRLVPQISTRISLSNPGMSGGGVGFRFNNFLINGVSERTLSGGVSNVFAGLKSMPLGAVQEYQVLLAPYDVRYGDFSGALVNAITKSGSNAFDGSAFVFARNDRLGRRGGGGSASYERVQYGLSVGGPLIRNRLHFFVAPEWQHFTYPMDGPYVGQPANAARPVPVPGADLARFESLMSEYGLAAGSAGAVENGSPLRNLYARFDLAAPEWNSRLIAWINYAGSDDLGFARAQTDSFSLSSYQATRLAIARAGALHLHTSLRGAGGGHNELLISHRTEDLHTAGAVDQPVVRVSLPSVAGGRVTLNSGTPPLAQGGFFETSARSVKDNLTLPFGARHLVTIGVEVERFRIARGGVPGSYGSWLFASLDDFAAGSPDRYEVGLDPGNANVALDGTHYAAYAGDHWQPTNRLSVTGGVRTELLAIEGGPPYQPAVDSLFGRRTDQMPRRRIEVSPRAGFVWHPSGTTQQLFRGGFGIFTSRYPLAWAHTALTSYGVRGGALRCNYLGAADRYPPSFSPDHRNPPMSCGGGFSVTPSFDGDVSLLDRNLRLMRVARASVAYERRLPGNLLLTNEALVTRGLSDFVFVNLNLPAPVATDPYGRVMYDTIAASGLVPQTGARFAEVIDLRNTGRNRSYQLSARLEITRERGANGFVSYTYSRVRDVQTPTRVNTRGTVAWGSARATGGRHDDMTASISANDLTHRVVVAGTYAAPWRGARTELSFYYVGESGRPFTYVAFGALGRGDLNADGVNSNDPIYIPRNALDPREMLLSGLSNSGTDTSGEAVAARAYSRRAAYQHFIDRTPCLRRQRGRIMARNSCREPWSNTTVASVRQFVPVSGRALEVQLDAFNVLNLINADWGLRREAVPELLEHIGQTDGSPDVSRPVFRYDPARQPWFTNAVESAFQLQLALRYRF